MTFNEILVIALSLSWLIAGFLIKLFAKKRAPDALVI